jgi:hypothetical protein
VNVVRTCPCGRQVRVKRQHGKYCSSRCRLTAWAIRKAAAVAQDGRFAAITRSCGPVTTRRDGHAAGNEAYGPTAAAASLMHAPRPATTDIPAAAQAHTIPGCAFHSDAPRESCVYCRQIAVAFSEC